MRGRRAGARVPRPAGGRPGREAAGPPGAGGRARPGAGLLRAGHFLVALLPIGLGLVLGMGVVEAYLMGPCADSPIFGAAGGHGQGFCYAMKGSMLAPALAGELVLLCILLFLLAAAKARLHDRIIGTVAGRRASGLAGVALLLSMNTPAVTSSLVLAGCTVAQPHAEADRLAGGQAGWCHIPLSAHPVLFEKVSKTTHWDYFDLRAAERLQRLILT